MSNFAEEVEQKSCIMRRNLLELLQLLGGATWNPVSQEAGMMVIVVSDSTKEQSIDAGAT